MNEEIRQLMNGIRLDQSIDNSGLNQMRNIINALDNLLTQMQGCNSPFEKLVKDIREFYFSNLVAAKYIFDILCNK